MGSGITIQIDELMVAVVKAMSFLRINMRNMFMYVEVR